VIVEPGAPTVTLLYQNFPNPFPSSNSSTTCIWFDLHRATNATLTVHDIRGSLVRTIVPSAQVSGAFVPGRYGRGVVGSNSGCDSRFVWDGKSDDGTFAPMGVYLLRLKTDYSVSFKKALYRGR
jgi:flagellar hook assembly protein FlgD